jgi:hypothetical protein
MRRPAILAAVTAVCLLCFGAGTARAQAPAQPGPGDFSFVVGASYAATKVDCENCEDAAYADTYNITLSPRWQVNRKVLAGLELVVQPSGRSDEVRTSWLLGTVQFHPWAGSGFFLKGGYGLLWVRTTLVIDGEENTGKFRGMVVNYGAGWHFRRDRRVSLAPFAAHYVQTVGSVVVDEFEAVNVVGNSWVAGMSIIFR